jgi:DUF1680 family protein
MYVTGGIGSVPNIEGFGRDYELDPRYSYSETCAALGSMLWNWEMTCITREPKYADLFEWQLYNAAAVGLGQDGTSYLYNNPLSCEGGITRAAWFKCPCCPSNISRVWADLWKYIFSYEEQQVWVHQYVGSELSIEPIGLRMRLSAGLPWDGKVKIMLDPNKAAEYTLYCRVPSWTHGLSVRINGRVERYAQPDTEAHETGSGYDPYQSWYLPIKRIWNKGDVLELDFGLGLNIWAAHPRIKSTLGQAAVSIGPLVYCLESLDNPEVNIFSAKLDPASLRIETDQQLFGGITSISGKTLDKKPLKFIPYSLWANRGESKMAVYINV